MIFLAMPDLKGNEKKYLDDCIDTTFVSSVGEYVTKSEKTVAGATGSKNACKCFRKLVAEDRHISLQYEYCGGGLVKGRCIGKEDSRQGIVTKCMLVCMRPCCCFEPKKASVEF